MFNLIFSLLYIYVTIFTVYFIIYAFMSLSSAKKVRDKYTPKDSNICVVVYATGNADTLENLLKQLKNQNYPDGNYTIYLILDKCENLSEVTLQGELKVNVINIDNIEPIGKSQAYSIIAEKLQDVENLDAYVFLDSKTYIEENFLTNVNFYLTKYEVFNPVITYFPQNDELSVMQKIKSIYFRYKNKFFNLSRFHLKLTNILDSDAFVITKSLLNKISVFDFRDIMSEVAYTYQLANKNIPVALIDEIKVYRNINDFNYRIPSLSKRLDFFRKNIFKAQSNMAREFLLSLCAPNWLCFIICFALPLINSHNFSATIGYTTILITVVIFLLAFFVGLFNMKFEPKEYMNLFLYPILSVCKLCYDIPFIRWIRKIISKTTHKRTIEKMTINVVINNGSKDFQAELELVSDDGLARVTFISPNGKKYTTKNNHLRMTDALKELSTKMKEFNLVLKTCQNCKYFQAVVDGSTNMVKGTCNCCFEGRTPGDMIPTLIWNTCPQFESQNVINLF